jgi:5-methyltetrahydropteroyltriglutamate--homocysteine methyltransferase
MIRSTDRIRTTHVGSLARPRALLDLMRAAAEGRPVDPAELAETERQAVADVVARQRAAGLDMISDGEQTKTGFYAYIGQRLSGFEPGHGPALVRTASWLQAVAGTLGATHQTTGGRRCQVHRRSISS